MQGLYFDTVKEPIKKGERVFSVIWMTGKNIVIIRVKLFLIIIILKINPFNSV